MENMNKPQPKPAQSLFEPSSLGSRRLLPEDLPYAAEVEAALARRPSRGARWLSVGVFLFFAAFIGWASVAMLDEVTHADGQVIASSRTQIIQNLEGGILRSVEVYEGQIVEKGSVLARLDNEMAESSLRDILHKAMENLTSIHRLRTQVQGNAGASLAWPEDLRTWLEQGAGYKLSEAQLEQGRRLTQVAQETFEVQMRQRQSELQVLRSQSDQRRHEVLHWSVDLKLHFSHLLFIMLERESIGLYASSGTTVAITSNHPFKRNARTRVPIIRTFLIIKDFFTAFCSSA